MIYASYPITAAERSLPKLALDFTTASLDARVAISRSGNTATTINSSGVIQVVNENLPRFDFDPITLKCKGLLIEESRTNLFINSLVDGSNLTTQSVTLSDIPYVLSFYGTGSVQISGGHSATVTGSGNFPNRKEYLFTPTAGSSTFTVSGNVSYAQLEAGDFVTSFIPTGASSVLRDADVANITGASFSDWFNSNAGTVVAEWIVNQIVYGASRVFWFDNTSTGQYVNSLTVRQGSASGLNKGVRADVNSGGAAQALLQVDSPTLLVGSQYSVCLAYAENNFSLSFEGGDIQTDNSGLLPSGLNAVRLGSHRDGSYLNGCVSRFMYYPQKLTNSEVQAFSK